MKTRPYLASLAAFVFLPAMPLQAQSIASSFSSPRSVVSDPADQLSRYLRVLAAEPRSLDALTGAGRAALELGDPNAAIGFYGRAEEISPRSGAVKAGLGACLLNMEQARDALRLFQNAVDLGVPEAEIAGDRGLAYDLRGDTRRAQRDYQLALTTREDPIVRRRLAVSQGISGDLNAAVLTLDPLLRKSDRAAWRDRVFILALTGDPAGAVAMARQLMYPNQVAELSPFLARMGALRPGQKALAVHFGHFPADGRPVEDAPVALADASDARRSVPVAARPAAGSALIPQGAALGRPSDVRPVPAPVPAPVLTPAPAPAPATAPVAAASIEAAPVAAPAPIAPPTAAPAVLPTTPGVTTPARSTTIGPPVELAATVPANVPPSQPVPAPVEARSDAAVTEMPTAEPVYAPRYDKPSNPAGAVQARPITPRPVETRPAAASPEPKPEPKPAAKPKPVPAKPQEKAEAETKPAKPKAGDAKATASGKAGKDAKADEAAKDAKSAAAKGAKGKPDPKAKPDAKDVKKPAAEKDGKKPDPKKPDAAKGKEPSRVWVQVAGGATKADLPKAFAALKAKAPDAYRGKSAWTTPLRFTNRLLIGPFKSSGEAQAYVNALTKAGQSGFVFSSPAGQAVEKLPVK